MTKVEVANEIAAFLDGQAGEWDWDEFVSLQLSDPELDAVRVLCAKLPELDPPVERGYYCGKKGISILAHLADDLRSGRSVMPISRYTE
jgi:hypothetical protein